MKKTIVAITLVVVLMTALAFSVYADTEKNTSPQWFKDMITWKKDQVKQAVNAGKITDEQAKQYLDRIDQMEKYHTQNGFKGNKGFGACHGQTNSNKIGPGMMNNSF